MLVLSRKATQKIHIGDNIVVTVVKVNKNKVRIGISAPSDVRVVRDELVARALPIPLSASLPDAVAMSPVSSS